MLVPPSFGPAFRHPITPADAARFFASVAENGAVRRVLLLRPARLPGWPACPEATARLRGVLDAVLGLPGLVWNDLPDGESLAAWRRGGEVEMAAVHAAMDPTPGVAAVFDIPADLAALQLALAAIAAEHGHAPPVVASGKPPIPVTLADIAQVESVIGQVELLDRLSARSVWALGPKGQKTLAMRSLRLDLQALLDALVPGRTLAPEPWLRALLARVACRRLLVQLAANPEIATAGPVAFPMDVSTLRSSLFVAFDDGLASRLRGNVVLKVPVEQAVADVVGFTDAARIAAAADVPVCLTRVRPSYLAAAAKIAAGATWVSLSGTATMPAEALLAAIPAELVPRVIIADAQHTTQLQALYEAGVFMASGPAADAYPEPVEPAQ